MARRSLLALVVFSFCLIAPAAHATDYCVAPNTTCGGTNEPTLEAALAQAASAPAADRIFLGAATYTAAASTGFNYNPGVARPVEVIGAGIGQTILTGQLSGSTAVLRLLTLAPGSSSIHDLTIRIPQSVQGGLIGLETDAPAQRIEVVEAPSQSSQHSGVRLHGVEMSDSTVTIGANTSNSAGILFADSGETLTRTTVTGPIAIGAAYGGTIRRCTIHGNGTGIDSGRGLTIITDSLVTVSDDGAFALALGAQNDAPSPTMTADGVTIVGPGAGHGAVGAGVGNTNDTTKSPTLNLTNSVIRGMDTALKATGTGQTVTLAASYDDFDPSGNVHTGTGVINQMSNSNFADADFINAAGGDYRLRFDSPLIESGQPGPVNTPNDLAGGARLVDGNLDGTPRRDKGAYEYQALAPAAVIAGPTAAAVSEAVTFDGTGSSDPDPGDTISYAWTLDGVAIGTTPTLGVTFTTAGQHTIGLTVTDPLGRQGLATKIVDVGVPPVQGGGEPQPTPSGATPDTVAPLVSGLLARPARARSGKRIRFSFTLSEDAAVTLRIERAVPGRRQAGVCRAPNKKNRRAKACTRFVRVTTLTLAGKKGADSLAFSGKVRGKPLAPGRYRAVITAVDAAGNRSVVRRVSFTVLKA